MQISRRIALAAALALCAPAHAQFSKGTLSTQINQNFPDNNTGQITPATTRAFLNNVVNSFQQYTGVNPQAGTSYTIQASDYGQLVTFNNASAVAVTLPQAAGSFATFNFNAKNSGAGTVTITPGGGSTINGASSLVLTTGQAAWIISDGTNYQIIQSLIGGSAAGGDLGGTYPNPTVLNLSHVTNGSLASSGLANTAVSAASYGDSTHYTTFTVNAQGQLTAAATQALPGGFTGFANPSATIGLSAVNGSATTAMRSDAAPALSQAIAPTWTQPHVFSNATTSAAFIGGPLVVGASSTSITGGLVYHSATNRNIAFVNSAIVTGPAIFAVNDSGANQVSLEISALGTTFTAGSASGTVIINPLAASYDLGLVVTQSSPNTGTVVGALAYNSVNVTDGASTTTDLRTWGFLVQHSITSNATGQKYGIGVELTRSVTTTMNGDLIGITPRAISSAPNNGNGGVFGANPQAIKLSGATDLNEIAGSESDVRIDSGAAANWRFGVAAVSTGAVRGSTFDAAYEIRNVVSGGEFLVGLLLHSQSSSLHPIATTGSVIADDGVTSTITNFASLPNTTISGNIFNFINFQLTGAAAMTLGTQQTTRGSLVLANTAAGAFATTIQSSNSATAAATLTLPPAAPASNGYVLSATTAGVMSWVAPGSALGVATATSLTTANVYGGSGASSSLTLASTSGAGTTDAIIFQTASQTERARITTGGLFNVGGALAPLYQFTVNANAAAPNATTTGTPIAQFIGTDNTSTIIFLDSFGSTNRLGSIVSRSARGTNASFTATQSGDILGFYGGIGAKAANTFAAENGTGGGGFLAFVASETWSSTAAGTEVRFYTTPNTTLSTAIAGRFQNSGGLSIGTATDPGIGSLLANIHLLAGTGTTPTISACGTGSPSITGGDNFGTVVAGGGVLASCVINFGKTWGAAPRCVASSGTAISSLTVSASTTQLTIGGTSLTGDTINWVCGSTALLEPANDNGLSSLSKAA